MRSDRSEKAVSYNVGEVLSALFAKFGGVVPLEEYVKSALYDPHCGYYTCQIADVGVRGDFTTAPGVSSLLAHALVKRGYCWLAQHRRALHHPRPGLIEVGAGGGQLMRDMLELLGWQGRLAWRPMIVETSPKLQRTQRERLGRLVRKWCKSPDEALKDCGGKGVMFANELADAFPPLIVEWQDGCWHEVCIGLDSSHAPVEILRLPSERCQQGIEASSMPPLIRSAGLAGGVRFEILFSFKEWLSDLVESCGSVELILIDYGGDAQTLLRRARRGTLRAYYRHQRFTGAEVARRFGRQDITCDVNFSDLTQWGRGLGFYVSEPVTLAHFLRGNLDQRDIRRADLSSARLLDPQDAGGFFHVLIMRR